MVRGSTELEEGPVQIVAGENPKQKGSTLVGAWLRKGLSVQRPE